MDSLQCSVVGVFTFVVDGLFTNEGNLTILS